MKKIAAKPKKPAGEIGVTKVSVGPNGVHTAELIPANLPGDKEALELQFAKAFVEAFNGKAIINGAGPSDATIEILAQNDTEDLDFKIKSSLADYLELAEVAPMSEVFGREIFRTGKFHVLEMARWIHRVLIQRKAIKYGPEVAGRTILLLYVTRWQFLLSDRTIECLSSLCLTNGCTFAHVYFVQGNGSDLHVLHQIWPWKGPPLPPPKAYHDLKLANLSPGQHQWEVDFDGMTPTGGEPS